MKAYGMAVELVFVSDFRSISLFFFSPLVSQAHSQVASALGGELAETFFKDVLACRSKLCVSKFFSFYFFLLCYAF